MYLENLGEQYLDLGSPEEGLRHYEEALEVRRELQRTHGDEVRYARQLGGALNALAGILRRLGKLTDSLGLCTEARKTLQPWQEKNPPDFSISITLAAALALEADNHADLHQLEQARSNLEAAAALFRSTQVRASSPVEENSYRATFSEVLWDLERVLRILNQPAKVVEDIQSERARLWSGCPATELVDLARGEAIRASVIEYGKQPSSAEAQNVRKIDLELIRSHIHLAATHGFHDQSKLESDSAFQGLFSTNEIKTLLGK
jgi:tetratricopeptide (TPR) repeat protein